MTRESNIYCSEKNNDDCESKTKKPRKCVFSSGKHFHYSLNKAGPHLCEILICPSALPSHEWILVTLRRPPPRTPRASWWWLLVMARRLSCRRRRRGSGLQDAARGRDSAFESLSYVMNHCGQVCARKECSKTVEGVPSGGCCLKSFDSMLCLESFRDELLSRINVWKLWWDETQTLNCGGQMAVVEIEHGELVWGEWVCGWWSQWLRYPDVGEMSIPSGDDSLFLHYLGKKKKDDPTVKGKWNATENNNCRKAKKEKYIAY